MSFNPFDDDFNDPLSEIDEVLDQVPLDARGGIAELDVIKQGNKTVINNFSSILRKINRPTPHVKKYFSTQLGVKTKLKGKQLIIDGNLSKEKLERVFSQYSMKYIICPACGKPDTLLQGKRAEQIQCLACGTLTSLT